MLESGAAGGRELGDGAFDLIAEYVGAAPRAFDTPGTYATDEFEGHLPIPLRNYQLVNLSIIRRLKSLCVHGYQGYKRLAAAYELPPELAALTDAASHLALLPFRRHIKVVGEGSGSSRSGLKPVGSSRSSSVFTRFVVSVDASSRVDSPIPPPAPKRRRGDDDPVIPAEKSSSAVDDDDDDGDDDEDDGDDDGGVGSDDGAGPRRRAAPVRSLAQSVVHVSKLYAAPMRVFGPCRWGFRGLGSGFWGSGFRGLAFR